RGQVPEQENNRKVRRGAMDKGRQPVSTSPSPEQVPVMIEASAPSTCLGRDGHFNRDTGTTRGDPPTQAGSDIFPQQPQQEHQAQPVVNCKAQQHDKRTILSVIDEDEAGEENSSGNGAGVDGSSTRKEKGEDRNEMDWPPTTKKFSPSAETAPAAVVMAVNTRAALVDHDHNRASNMPVLSAGPHFPYKPERSTGGPLTSLFRLNKPKHQEQQGPQRRPRRHRQSNKMDSLTPRKGGCGTYTTPPNSRPRIHKMPSMFGMLQDAHDQAAPSCVATCTLSSNPHCGSGGSIIEEPGGDESSAAAGIVDGGVTAGNVTAGHNGLGWGQGRVPQERDARAGGGGGEERRGAAAFDLAIHQSATYGRPRGGTAADRRYATTKGKFRAFHPTVAGTQAAHAGPRRRNRPEEREAHDSVRADHPD
ncbi:unnamed protein product, partial [Ectocarpus sp. 13 AM-2016]